jgi:hypothetical protein
MARYKLGAIKSGPFKGMLDSHVNFVIEYVKDFNARRAAEASGFVADTGYQLRGRKDVDKAISYILSCRLEASDIDAEWVLMEAVDNVLIARQQGKISASNTALSLVAKHAMVDAMSAEKIHIDGADEIVMRLKRARERLKQPAEVSFL